MHRIRISHLAPVLALLLTVSVSHAQGRGATRSPERESPRRVDLRADRSVLRVSFALEQTDQRIVQADRALGADAEPAALSELTHARELQERARTALAQGQPGLAMQLTLEARQHVPQAGPALRGLPTAARVSLQLERTRDLLGRSRERLAGCDQPESRDELAAADMMQARADSALTEGRSLAALELSMDARNRAFRALQACNLGEDLPGTLDFALRRTDQVLTRARNATSKSGDGGAQQSLQEAMRLQGQAHEESRLQHVETSLRLTHSARAAARRAVELSRGR